ncbi:MAG: AmmeMemoRadiSam system radical SAM enzyme [Treponema sp.]|nr:AmmeMemoRadiSam system radical SAM enzyme [Treponema sp.]
MRNEGAPKFFSSREDGKILCSLCPHNCLLPPGGAGKCLVRFNASGAADSAADGAADGRADDRADDRADIPFYGFITGLAVDPIEKKPLYHFRPGTSILSLGFTGCNLYCPFCQNRHISRNTNTQGKYYSPAELIEAAQKMPGAPAIAYTYSEPLVHIEFLLDCMKEARNAGVANILVSNGCINNAPAREILKYTDAANIDLKCFNNDTYKNVLGGDLNTVCDFISAALEEGVHLEITTLIVPGLNDSKTELDMCRDFIADLHKGKNRAEVAIPWHLSACHPNSEWNRPATEAAFIKGIAARANEKLPYVYTGNIISDNKTLCQNCRACLISRRGFYADISGLLLEKETGKYICASCGKKVPVWN